MRSITRWSPIVLSLFTLAVACDRPPVGPPPNDDDGPKPGFAGPLDIFVFVQDRHVIEGKWYEYDPSTHLQEPRPFAWIVRDDDGAGTERHAAINMRSIYADTDSGVYTLGVRIHDGTSWGAEETYVSSKNVKNDGRVCVDLFTRDEASCSGTDWQLRLEYFRYFSPASAFYVNNPGLFFRSIAGSTGYGRVMAARIDAADLDDLPAPDSIDVLLDEPDDDWESTEWGFSSYAADLPAAGMAIGSRFVDAGFVGRDDVYFMFSHRFDLVRFTVRPVTDGDPSAGLVISYASIEMSFEDFTFPDSYPEPVSVTVPVPATDGPTWVSFKVDGLFPAAADLDGAEWPHIPPSSREWDLAVVRTGDDVRLWLSPSAAIINATQQGRDIELPPIFEE